MLLREIKKTFHWELDDAYGKEEVDSFFYLAVEHHLGMERFVLAIHPDTVVSKPQEGLLFKTLSQLKLGRPIQYILGSVQFMDLEIKVNEAVLIPRPETEELVRWVIEDLRHRNKNSVATDFVAPELDAVAADILDIGTGSGCIAIALAKHLPAAQLSAIDVSLKALEVARENAVMNQVEIQYYKADIMELSDWKERYDIIVSNPPYVRESEKTAMHSNVKDHEPHLALFVSDERPLIFYEKIIGFAKKRLKKGGCIYLEINQYLAEATKSLLTAAQFADVQLRKDLYGNNRMLKGTLK